MRGTASTPGKKTWFDIGSIRKNAVGVPSAERSRSMTFIRLLLVALVPGSLLLTGCFSYHPASGPALAAVPLAGDDWPEFDTAPIESLAKIPETISRYTLDLERLQPALKNHYADNAELVLAKIREAADMPITENRLTEHGLIRAWDDFYESNRETEVSEWSFSGKLEKFIPNAAFLTADELAWQQERRRSRQDHGVDVHLDEPSAPIYGTIGTGETERWELEEGMRLRIPKDVSPDAPGLIIHITSLYENKWEHDTIRRFQAHGWAVAHLDSETNLREPNATEYMRIQDRRRQRTMELDRPLVEAETERIMAGEELKQDARAEFERMRAYQDQVNAEFPNIENGFGIKPDTDIPAHAAMIAGKADQKIALHAYAAEAMLSSIDRMYPQLADRPVVVMGFSAGAIVAPTVAARLHEMFPGRTLLLVMVGGGGDLLTISRESDLTDGGIQLIAFYSGTRPTDEQIAGLQAAYEQSARLDPLRAAEAIRDIPVLHIYANNDTIVPTPAAERFNAAHGNVDRLVHSGNHGTLFYFVSGQAGKIRSWLRTHGAD